MCQIRRSDSRSSLSHTGSYSATKSCPLTITLQCTQAHKRFTIMRTQNRGDGSAPDFKL